NSGRRYALSAVFSRNFMGKSNRRHPIVIQFLDLSGGAVHCRAGGRRFQLLQSQSGRTSGFRTKSAALIPPALGRRFMDFCFPANKGEIGKKRPAPDTWKRNCVRSLSFGQSIGQSPRRARTRGGHDGGNAVPFG